MLPPGKQLPHLRVLQLAAGAADEAWECTVDAAVISSIVASCPGLQQLELINVVSPPSAVSSLTQLQLQLTSLSVAGNAFADAAVGLVAQMTGLKSLTWGPRTSHYPSVSRTGLQGLTALRGLTRLELQGWRSCGAGLVPCGGFYLPEVKVVLESRSEVGRSQLCCRRPCCTCAVGGCIDI